MKKLVPMLVLVLCCLTVSAGSVSSQSTAVVEAGTFAIGGGESVAVEHGRFTVPANRHSAGVSMLTLRYVRFPSTAARPGPPIVFLAGGPGDAASRAFRSMPRTWLDPLRAIADVVAFDQRGTGTSEPTGAVCAPGGGAPLDRQSDPIALASSIKDRLAACLPALARSGIDVDGLTTEESADDVNDLRAALGVPQIMLLAGSYGTHLGLSVARRHPRAVARMALLGVEGPDDTIKLPARVQATLVEIDKTHQGLTAAIGTLLERLRREPWTKTLPNGQRVTVGAWDLQRRVAEALDTVPEIEALPAAMATMLAGDYSDLVRWAIPFRSPRPINVMNVAMDCASFASAGRLATIQAQAPTTVLGDAINFPLPAACEAPGLPRLTAAFRAPLVSSVPALLVAGTFDGRTPPANVEVLATGLTHARVLVIPRASHSLFREPLVLEALTSFLREQPKK